MYIFCIVYIMNTKFIHFGCWNNLNTKKNKKLGCLEQMSKLLHEYMLRSISPLNFMIVAGDNYYPDKIKIDELQKKKLVYTDKLLQGFDLLPQDLSIYMLLGNHDLETNIGPEPSMFINDLETPEIKESCTILNTEKEIVRDRSNIELLLFKEFLLNENTLIIMLDTTMYMTDSHLYLTCYNHFVNNMIHFDSIEKVREYQNSLIIETIQKYRNITNLILVGHHPITGLKIKKDKLKLLNDVPYFIDILKIIYDILGSSINYFYLCADLHLYQEGMIYLKLDTETNMEIHQYIVGTGGTELDDEISTDLIGTNTGDDLFRYQLLDSKKECGFLECTLTNNNILNFNFISVNILREGGKNKKTLVKKIKNKKNKKRYITIKKQKRHIRKKI